MQVHPLNPFSTIQGDTLRTDLTYEHLAAVRDYLPELDRALIPSFTRRRHWNQRELTDGARAAMNTQAIAEREAKHVNLAQGLKSLGNAPAPLNLNVLDARDRITIGVAELEDAVCDRLGLTPLAHPTTAERITRIIGLLDRIAVQDDLADHVHREAVRLRGSARIALGEAEPVVRLTARCVVCQSVSLRAFLERGVVACVNDACRCDDTDCRCQATQHPQHHTWPFEHWPWLLPLLHEEIGVEA